MNFDFTVSVEVERVAGKFAPKDEISEAIREAIEQGAQDAEVSGHDTDGTSEYEVLDVAVDDAGPRRAVVFPEGAFQDLPREWQRFVVGVLESRANDDRSWALLQDALVRGAEPPPAPPPVLV